MKQMLGLIGQIAMTEQVVEALTPAREFRPEHPPLVTRLQLQQFAMLGLVV